MKIRRITGLAAMAALAATLGAQENETPRIALHLQPDADSEVVAEVPTDHEAVTEGSPVLDEAKAAEGWMWTEYPGTFEGFVENADIGKNLAAVPGALVYAEDSATSRLLTVIESGDEATVSGPGGDWMPVEFTKAVPVYFVDPDYEPEPEEAPPVPLAGGEPAAETAAPPAQEAALPRAEAPEAGQPGGAPAEGIRRTVEGTLETSSTNLFRRNHQLQLVDAQGRRLAWVKTDDLVGAGRVQNYLGREVSIYGEIRTEGGDVFLYARSIRPR